jgi:hypothetical protein
MRTLFDNDQNGGTLNRPRTSPLFRWVAVAAAAVSWCAYLAGPLVAQTGSTGSTTQQPGWLFNQASLIAPGVLPSHLAISLQQTGARMMTTDKAQVALTGSITDSQGTRSAQFTIQAPGYMMYRDSTGHAVVFNGTSLASTGGTALSSSDAAIAESLLAHFPDMVCLQVATGGSYRRIGSHFRTDGSTGGTYTGPYWTVLAFAPAARQGLTAGAALQQQLFIAIDESTGFISEVRMAVNTGSQQLQITQTQFANWTNQSGQWYPGSIVRLVNGKQVFSFQAQAITVGAAGPTTAFIP